MTDAQQIQFPFTGRYYTLGQPGPHITELIYVLHGQGQLARYFIKKFSPITRHDRLVVAPEGLSKYYLQGYNGRVGATWMTSENRETDIQNYITYLNHVHQQASHALAPDVNITVLGFSQGAATVTRWLLDGTIIASRLILWAGLLPFDMNMSNTDRLASTEKIFVYGNEDPFLNDERTREMQQLMHQSGLPFKEITFNGAHEIDTPALQSLF